MKQSEITWNDEAKTKILIDADKVLREAVVDLAASTTGASTEEVFAALNSRLKDRFIDYEPGPDIRKYADAISSGHIETGD